MLKQVQHDMTHYFMTFAKVSIRSVEEIRDKIPGVTTLPALVDEENVVQGSDPIVARLEEIKKFKELWDKLQSDDCSCDEEAFD
jgi:hypothetical protein